MRWGLWNRVVEHARRDGGHVVYVEQAIGRSITYSELVDAVWSPRPCTHGRGSAEREIAGDPADPLPNPLPEYRARGPEAASVEVLRLGNRIDFVVRFLTAMLHDRTVLLVDPAAPPPEVDRLTALADDAPTGPAVLLASSGTTGKPKLVRRDRASLDAVARAMAEAIGFTADDRVLAAVPLGHSYGLEHGLLSPLWAGSTVLLCEGLDLPPLAAAWRAGVTLFPAVPSMLELLLRSELSTTAPPRIVYTAGAPLPKAVGDAFERAYSVGVGQVYGMTEIGSATYRDPSRDRPGTVGRAVAGVSLKIDCDGQLLVRSDAMLSGYIGDTLALVDGHFATGDLATLDTSGELTLVGRTRLLIDVGGAKVNPHEVEAVLAEHPGVAAAVVLPLSLSATVRKVRAVVEAVDPQRPPDAAALRAFVRARLAAHKVPRLIEFRDRLPRTAAGKIARQLVEMP